MKKSRLFPWFGAVAAALVQLSFAQENPSQKIDAFLESAYKQHNIKPNAPANDETMCRRLYLDIIGRIPTKDELTAFINDQDTGKRAKLIDKLLNSEGYVSHWYNYWADILRVQTGMRNEAGAAYADWVKKSLRSNMPYDQFVRELVTAKGYVWDNGAVGYYMRDAGMPLDNMSNTAQVFLGTRVVCAQCHNHPFDKWKQRDYFEMAAFTYGVDTQMSPDAICPDLDKEKEKLMKDEARAAKRKGGRKPAAVRELDGMIRDILEPLSYGVSEQKRELKLPMDYKYDDAKPGQVIDKAKALFALDRVDKDGTAVKLDKDMRSDLANWMCDKQNARFTTVICNRLWKRCFGMGLIEPVDDFKDDTVASNAPLMKFLTEQMARQKYDVKQFLRMVYNTRAYQRECTTGDVNQEAPYYFPGPLLRRMSSEQIWDSVVTLMIPEPDLRHKNSGYADRLQKMKAAAAELKKKYVDNPHGAKALLQEAQAMASAGKEFDSKLAVAREKLTKARDKKDAAAEKAAQAEVNKLNQDKQKAIYAAQADAEKKSAMEEDKEINLFKKPMAMDKKEDSMMGKDTPDPLAGRTAPDYNGYGDAYFRASEISSPAPNGHFLRDFGQSDRNVIENSWIDASVTQALMLMNGQIFDDLTSDKSQLAKAMQYALSVNEKATNLWMTVLNRTPSDAEKKLVAETTQGKGAHAWKDVFWALLNGREFIFIQ